MGTDCFYLPNDNDAARDLIYGEDPLKEFTSAYAIELYPSNVMEYAGERDFFSKFSLEIRNNVTVIMSRRTFDTRVGRPGGYSRPREGDLIYVPVLNGQGDLYEIRFVNQNKDMVMLGRPVPYFYELELEKFKYSNEVIDTGVPDIDIIEVLEKYSQKFPLDNTHGKFTLGETVYQSTDGTFANASCSGILATYDFPNSIITVNTAKGDFTANTIIYGLTSSANGRVMSENEYEEAESQAAPYDNEVIHREANNFVSKTESNALGKIGGI